MRRKTRFATQTTRPPQAVRIALRFSGAVARQVARRHLFPSRGRLAATTQFIRRGRSYLPVPLFDGRIRSATTEKSIAFHSLSLRKSTRTLRNAERSFASPGIGPYANTVLALPVQGRVAREARRKGCPSAVFTPQRECAGCGSVHPLCCRSPNTRAFRDRRRSLW